ncbi:hypothetical protein BDV59DRAFT_176896 [Aspergillus ambiguus]|uniref:uncharacterized protein n=1 Tax=Aspergillus ambiguus TaxID=176160 RepID=UPI003CCD811C
MVNSTRSTHPRMSSAAKEKKRAADREAQRLNRARTKAYITHLERTLQDLTGPNPLDNLSQKLAQQQEKINHLQNTLHKIGILSQDAANALLPSASDRQLIRPSDFSQAAAENESLANGICDTPNATTCTFFDMDLTCSDRERNYLAVLGSAVTLIQDCLPVISENLTLMPELNDDFCIRAVVDGWKATTDRFGADVIWNLIQAIDEGLFFRADPVTRIALLRIMRSLLLQRLGMTHETSSVPEYMLASPIQTSIVHQPFLDFFPWPEFRDHWIANGTEYVNELCAASFSARIRFQWPFELRDVFHKRVLTGTLSFSEEFESRYRDLASWRLDADGDWPYRQVDGCQILPGEVPLPPLALGDQNPWDSAVQGLGAGY